MNQSVPLTEQVVLITGASSGIGAALAEVLAQQYPGINLVLASRNQPLLEAVADRCRQYKAEVLVVPTDLSQIDQQLKLWGWSADKTAKAIAKIIAKPKPKPRYVLATGEKTTIFFMNTILPTWARDEFWKRFYGVNKI